MNFLAHLHLGRHTPEFLLGSLLGDLVRGRIEDDQFTLEIREGIRLHRAIDAFTDQNRHWKRSKQRLPKPLRRYAGVIVDVFYDHLLTVHWQRFADMEIAAFIDHCHDSVLASSHHVEADWRPFFDRLVAEEWLASYATIDGIGLALERISRRSPRFVPMAGSESELRNEFAGFEEDFLTFYPDAMAFAREAAESGQAAGL